MQLSRPPDTESRSPIIWEASWGSTLFKKGPLSIFKDFEALQKVVAYLQTTKDLGLIYNSTSARQSKTVARLLAWIDAAYLIDTDFKSTSEISFSLDEGSGVFHA